MNQRIVILLLLSIASIGRGAADSNLRANVVVSHHQRRELTWTWWTNLMQLLGPAHHNHGSSSGSSSGSSGSGSGGGSSSDGGSSSGGDSSSSGGSSGSDGSDTSDASDEEVIEGDESDEEGITYEELEYGENYSVAGGGVGSSIGGIKGTASVLIYIVAAMVATVIGAAMVVVWKKRQARNEIVVAQPLGRSIVRRTPGAFVEIESVRTPHYKAPTAPAVLLAEC